MVTPVTLSPSINSALDNSKPVLADQPLPRLFDMGGLHDFVLPFIPSLNRTRDCLRISCINIILFDDPTPKEQNGAPEIRPACAAVDL